MKTANLIGALALVTFTATAQANRTEFLAIAEVASIGNGGADVTSYDTKLTKAQLQAQGKAELEADYWEDCGPWKNITSRRKALKTIGEIESWGGEAPSVMEKLNALYANKEIFAVVGAVSNNDISCSVTWVNIYGTDGSKLELRYNMGD